jgi:trimeric autotransporter adhesin
LPKATSASAIGDSIIAESAGKIGIGTSSPSSVLTAKGSSNTTVLSIENGSATSIFGVGVDNLGNGSLSLKNSAGTSMVGSSINPAIGPKFSINSSDADRGDGTASTSGAALSISTPYAVGQENGIFFTNTGATPGSAITGYTAATGVFGIGGLKFKTNPSGTNFLATRMTITETGKVGIGTTTPASKLEVNGAVSSTVNTIATGATVDLALSNTHTLASVGGSTITLQNMVDGGVYNIIVEDTTVATYSFAGCTNTYWKPARAPTTAATRTVFGILAAKKPGPTYDCYVTWSSGFTP